MRPGRVLACVRRLLLVVGVAFAALAGFVFLQSSGGPPAAARAFGPTDCALLPSAGWMGGLYTPFVPLTAAGHDGQPTPFLPADCLALPLPRCPAALAASAPP